MAKESESDNSILLIGGLAIAAFFLFNRKSTPVANNMMYPNTGGYVQTRPGYNVPQTGGSGNIIQSTGSAIADIINAIKGKNVAVIEPAPQGFDYDAWSQQVSDPEYWDTYYGGNYENYT